MALNTGDSILANEFNTLKNLVHNELVRRSRHTFSFDNSNVTASTTFTLDTIFNNLIRPLRTINDETTNYALVNKSDIIRAIKSLETVTNTFATKPFTGYNSGCKGSCIGLCEGCDTTCLTGCSGTCTSGCSGCTSCTSCTSCSGCTSCTSCDGCSGCGSGCDGGCSGGCNDSCASYDPCSDCDSGCKYRCGNGCNLTCRVACDEVCECRNSTR